MNIGDYVRTKDGTIGKIIAIDLAKPRQEQYPNHPSKSYWRDKILISCYRGWRTLQNVEKISSNIIDLIEAGDYVNGYKVSFIDKDVDTFVQCDYPVQEGSTNHYRFYSKGIYSILTKEQFESLEYKIGD